MKTRTSRSAYPNDENVSHCDRPSRHYRERIYHPCRWFQYEGGYQYSHSESLLPGGEIIDIHQVEQVLRFGINRRFEVRSVINSNTQKYDNPSTWNDPYRRTGVSPLTIGFKYNLLEESNKMPQMTWLSHTTFLGFP